MCPQATCRRGGFLTLRTPALAILVVLGTVALSTVGSLAPPSFTSATVKLRETNTEPSIIAAPALGSCAAALYYTNPSGSLYRSTNSGATWAAVAATDGGGGDGDLAVDGNGAVYVTELTDTTGAGMLVSVSTNCGTSWAHRVVLPSSGGFDRQWIAARGNGIAILTARLGGEVDAWRTTDSGVTWTGPVVVTTDENVHGHLVYDTSGTAWAAYTGPNGIKYYKSTDDGATWSTGVIANVDQSCAMAICLQFPQIDADAGGNLYAAWTSGAGTIKILPSPGFTTNAIFVSKSTNGGSTWSTPQRITDGVHGTLFPYVAAGAAGHVDVSYAIIATGATNGGEFDPNFGGPTTIWDMRLAQSLNGNATTPTWTTSVVQAAFHTGSICTQGLACPGPQNVGFGNAPTPFDRRLLDFFAMDTDSAGNAYVAFAQDRTAVQDIQSDLSGTIILGNGIVSWSDLMVGRQTAGTTV